MRACGAEAAADASGAGAAVFIVNLRTENWIGPEARRDMIWQHFLRLPSEERGRDGRWVDVRLPLDDFYLTYRGRLVENETDMGERLESVGISVASPAAAEGADPEASSEAVAARAAGDVPFCLDISAVWLERQGLRRARRAR